MIRINLLPEDLREEALSEAELEQLIDEAEPELAAYVQRLRDTNEELRQMVEELEQALTEANEMADTPDL